MPVRATRVDNCSPAGDLSTFVVDLAVAVLVGGTQQLLGVRGRHTAAEGGQGGSQFAGVDEPVAVDVEHLERGSHALLGVSRPLAQRALAPGFALRLDQLELLETDAAVACRRNATRHQNNVCGRHNTV